MELCSLDIRELSWAWQHSWSSEDEDSEAEAEGDNTGDSAEAGEDTVQPPTQEEEDTMESLHPASAAEAGAGHTEDSSAPRLLSSGTASAAQEVNTASGGSDEAEEVTTEVPVEVTVEVTTEVLARLLCAEIVLDLLEDTFYISPPLPGHGGQEQEQEQEQEHRGQEVCEVILQEAVTSAVALVEVKSKGGNDISL